MYVVFQCIDCKRSWTGLHNNRCPDVRCAGICEIITAIPGLPFQGDYDTSSGGQFNQYVLLPPAANSNTSSQTYLPKIENEHSKDGKHPKLDEIEGNEVSSIYTAQMERSLSSLHVNSDHSEYEHSTAYHSHKTEHDPYQAIKKPDGLHLEADQAKQAMGPNKHFYNTSTSESVGTKLAEAVSFEKQVERTTDWATVARGKGDTNITLDDQARQNMADSVGKGIAVTSKAEVIGVDPVDVEVAKKKRNKRKKKTKHQSDPITTAIPSTDINSKPHGKQTTTSKKNNKSAGRARVEAPKFKNVHLPLPDYLLSLQTASSTSPASKAGSFADAVAAAPETPQSAAFAHESGWTTVGARKIVKPKLTENASSYLVGTEGGAFGTTTAPSDVDERNQKSGVHKVEWDFRKAKHSVRTVVPRM